ncbi:hypothetical protein LTR28_004953 [Elasticomyces elasticus]|nr:hypothetical protein LTR28_004953 [Elasticomyces elasticus]
MYGFDPYGRGRQSNRSQPPTALSNALVRAGRRNASTTRSSMGVDHYDQDANRGFDVDRPTRSRRSESLAPASRGTALQRSASIQGGRRRSDSQADAGRGTGNDVARQGVPDFLQGVNLNDLQGAGVTAEEEITIERDQQVAKAATAERTQGRGRRGYVGSPLTSAALVSPPALVLPEEVPDGWIGREPQLHPIDPSMLELQSTTALLELGGRIIRFYSYTDPFDDGFSQPSLDRLSLSIFGVRANGPRIHPRRGETLLRIGRIISTRRNGNGSARAQATAQADQGEKVVIKRKIQIAPRQKPHETEEDFNKKVDEAVNKRLQPMIKAGQTLAQKMSREVQELKANQAMRPRQAEPEPVGNRGQRMLVAPPPPPTSFDRPPAATVSQRRPIAEERDDYDDYNNDRPVVQQRNEWPETPAPISRQMVPPQPFANQGWQSMYESKQESYTHTKQSVSYGHSKQPMQRAPAPRLPAQMLQRSIPAHPQEERDPPPSTSDVTAKTRGSYGDHSKSYGGPSLPPSVEPPTDIPPRGLPRPQCLRDKSSANVPSSPPTALALRPAEKTTRSKPTPNKASSSTQVQSKPDPKPHVRESAQTRERATTRVHEEPGPPPKYQAAWETNVQLREKTPAATSNQQDRPKRHGGGQQRSTALAPQEDGDKPGKSKSGKLLDKDKSDKSTKR